jgi:phosphoglycolate phosphatase
MPRSLLVFDLDGTLIDSCVDISAAANLARVAFGFTEANLETLHRNIGLPARELFQDLSLNELQMLEIVTSFREYLSMSMENGSVFFPGVLDFLRAANENGHSLAIATNKPMDLARKLVSHCELKELIQLTVGVGKFSAKPSPTMINYCTEYFDASSTIMFGDRVEDIQAANMSGASAIGVVQGIHTEQELFTSGASHVFPDFGKIHEYFALNVWGR